MTRDETAATRTHVLTNARVVTPEWDDLGTVVIDDGIISDVVRGRRFRDGVDLDGLWLAPGCIDIHSDYLEKEIRPRPAAEFSLGLAFHFMDQRAIASGLTTVMSAISFTDQKTEDGRNFASAITRARRLDALARGALARHYVHARLDPNTDAVLAHMEALKDIDALRLVVYNDSIPGQRQFPFEQLVETRAERQGISQAESRSRLEAQVAERSQVNRRADIAAALAGSHVLGSHDDTTCAHVDEAHATAATLAEMPTTMEAAQRAKALGMWVCMGAPNYVRGGSHCGNLACADAMAEGLVDMICSDYHFPSMFGAVVKMMADGVSPPRCFDYVARNPARMLGLGDQLGSVEPGKRADLVAFSREDDFARIIRVWVDGREKLRIGQALEPEEQL